MEKPAFIARFRAEIRVRVDWQAFLTGPWTVRCERLRLPEALPRLWTPWYANAAAGPPAADPSAWPLSVSEAAANRHRLGRNQDSLDKHMAAWRDEAVIEAPAFAIPRGGYLLLDRNHRIVAGALLQGAAILELAVIEGPPGADLLPDLPRFS
jgi:hypothetical protein